MTDWGTAIVVDPRHLESLRSEVTDLKRHRKRLVVLAYGLAAMVAVALPVLWKLAARGGAS